MVAETDAAGKARRRPAVVAPVPPGTGRRDVSARPRLLFLVTEDWYFWSHRLPAARAARDAGFDVLVATRVAAHGERIKGEGFRLVPLAWDRGRFNPLWLARELADLVRLYRRERPDLVHHVAIKPAVLGGLAAVLAGVPAMVATLAGRGLSLSGDGLKSRLAGCAVRAALRLCAMGRRTTLVVQNPEDRAWLARAPAVPNLVLVPGSGVDVRAMTQLPEPQGPFTVAQVSRMLTLKGVADTVGAVRRLRAQGHDVRLLLAGGSDPDSMAAIPEPQLRAWGEEPGVTWLGHVADIRTVWAQAHLALLPSHGGEGVPKSLLEAAACGRPMVASDVPGVREVARHGVNALLVPPRDPTALADAIRTLMLDGALRRDLAAASRAVVDPGLSDQAVGARMVEIYRSVLPASPVGQTPAEIPA